MKKLLIGFIAFLLPITASAVNITVPQATAFGVVLRGNANGTYSPVATSTLGIGGSGTVTSVSLTVPTGLTVGGVPITTSGTAAITYSAGYSIPLTASTTEGHNAYASTTLLSATAPITYTGSTGIIACNVASASQPGCLASADFTTFNNKQTLITGSTGQVVYMSGTNTAVGTSTVFIASSGNVGIGTSSPSNALEVNGVTYSKGHTFAATGTPSYVRGRLVYDTGNEALTFYNNDSNIALQVGQEEWIRVFNSGTSTIANGSAVYINGSNGTIATVALAQANNGSTTVVAGLATEDIAANATGTVTSMGLVNGLNTAAYTAGSIVFLSATTPGGLATTSPRSPNYRYRIGFVSSSATTTGSIHVTPSTAAIGNGDPGTILSINPTGNQAFQSTTTLGLLGTNNVSTLTTNFLPKWSSPNFINSLIFDNGVSVGISSSTVNALNKLTVGGNLFVAGNSTTTGAVSTTATTSSLAITSITNSFLAANGTGQIVSTTTPSFGLTGTTGQIAYFSGTNTAVGTSSVVIVAGNVGIGTTTPATILSVSSGSILVAEKSVATSTSVAIDWSAGNQTLLTNVGANAVTFTFSNAKAGQTQRVVTCNPATGAVGSLTWPAMIWSGSTTTAPTPSTAVNACNVWSFLGTAATSSSANSPRIYGSLNAF